MPTDEGPKEADVLGVLAAFARMHAHDMGNPLSGLSLSLEMLEQTDLSVSQRRYVERCRNACEKLLQYQQGVSALAGGGREAHAPCDLRELVRRAAARIGRAMEGAESTSRAAVVRLHMGAGAEHVVAAESLLEESLFICLQNGDESAPTGDMHVVTQVAADGIHVAVRDAGEGVPEALVPRLFRERCTTKARAGGLGLLRLALIVERHHGGKLFYQRLPEGQTTFVTVWPTSFPP